MMKPKRLKPGDKIALVSLSSGMGGDEIFLHRTKLGIQRLKQEFDLNAVTMSHALKGSAYLDQHPEARAEDLMIAFRDPEIKAIVTMIGGDDTIRLLPYIDFEVIRNNPKIFMGYSDTTINHFMMYHAGLTSYYGPCLLDEFAENGAMHEYTKKYIRSILFEHHDRVPVTPSDSWTCEFLDWADPANNSIPRKMISDDKRYQLLQGCGTVSGRLIGGCADVMPMIIGTPIWPEPAAWQDCILFLETSEEQPTPSTLKYLLRGLAAQGIIAAISGILVGKPRDEKYYDEYKEVLLQVIGREAGRPELPILYNMNFGHTSPSCILPYGIMGEINCADSSFTIIEAAVE